MTQTIERNKTIRETMLAQIGTMNVLAISGGRWTSKLTATGRTVTDSTGGQWEPLTVAVTLPVSNGYRVEVAYNEGADTYQVTRWFIRGTKAWAKKVTKDVYASEVGEVAYQASCFRNN